jgi:predicted RNA-binding protein with PIN domain
VDDRSAALGRRHWIVDGNNVLGARPDGWWNDRVGATRRLTQTIAEWCRIHEDVVTVVYDGDLDPTVSELAGGNLTVLGSRRRGRDAADHRIVDLAHELVATGEVHLAVVSSDRGLVARLPSGVEVIGAGSFRSLLDRRGS